MHSRNIVIVDVYIVEEVQFYSSDVVEEIQSTPEDVIQEIRLSREGDTSMAFSLEVM